MNQGAWLAQRAALALLLMVSFYALALGIAGMLLVISYEAYANDVQLAGKIAVVCVPLAGTIVWSILPRIDRFEAPGPELSSAEVPELFSVLTEVARTTGQHMPAHVYLVNDVNAFVTHRGGLMGIGSRRVMGIGLPLLQSLTVQEFKAVIAHEFGHYHSGDVKIGPWIYKTRAAIGRTIEKLSDSSLQKVFVAYGNLFLRVTHAVSRRQEFIADEVAAKTAGAAMMASALRKVHGSALAFRTYWQAEVWPLLNSGYLPPLAAGFAKFLQVESVSSGVAEAVRVEEAEGESTEYDTHPPLRERVAALHRFPQGSTGDTRPAVSLLGDPTRWERRLLGVAYNEDFARPLTPLAWEKVVETVYAPRWRNGAKRNARLLPGITSPVRFPFAGRLTVIAGQLDPAAKPILEQVEAATMALSLALLDAGWSPVRSPGKEIAFHRDGHEVRVFHELMLLAMGKTSAEEWAAQCGELGIEGLALEEARRA